MKNNEMLSKMIKLATTHHNGQFDKSGMPYILHCLKVMDLLNTKDIELMCIAVGHDLIEDTDITENILRTEGISERVINGILSLTKIDGEDYDDYKVRVKKNPDAVLVKIADLTHNTNIDRLKVITQKDMDRTLKYYQFYIELIDIKRNASRLAIATINDSYEKQVYNRV